VSAASTALVYGATFVVGRRIGRYDVVDVTWGLSLVAVAAAAGVADDGDLVRRLLLLTLVTVWGLRLASHIREYRSPTSAFVPRPPRSRIS
jgi:steroid 5-alpha reductase family enzyme